MSYLAFTLCSINYLAQAKSLFESLQKTNPHWQFVIGLVDRNDNRTDLSFLHCTVIEVDKLAIDGFDDMVKQYTLVELLTSVKPFYIEWLFKHYPEATAVVYFDPDIVLLLPLLHGMPFRESWQALYRGPAIPRHHKNLLRLP